ncbi:DUF732 domain-containing protein [Streptomyces sp. NPDC020875]|uniref:DUF732 domain-containing protein n=1 Tax=Streptomyces sp. NPDC020875 TaxID=3154898 RepID=UPI0033C5145B
MDRKKWIIIGAAAVAFGGVLSLVQDGDDSTDKPTATKSATATTDPADTPSTTPSKPPTGTGVPTPDTAQRAALISALTAVDTGLVTKEDRAVSRARSTCLDIKQGKEASAVQSNTKQRFEGGTVPSLSDDQAAAIVAAVKSSFCS